MFEEKVVRTDWNLYTYKKLKEGRKDRDVFILKKFFFRTRTRKKFYHEKER